MYIADPSLKKPTPGRGKRYDKNKLVNYAFSVKILSKWNLNELTVPNTIEMELKRINGSKYY